MFAVVTNSRRFAIHKLMTNYGMRPPMNEVQFITTTAELQEWRKEKTSNNEPMYGLLIWQRGRSSEDAKKLATITRELIGTDIIKKPRINGAIL